MKILFIGDIVGRPGRQIIQEKLPKLRREGKYDFVIANAENTSHGKGLTVNHAEDLLKAGIDCLTSGNHIWKLKEIYPKLEDKSFPLIRPANYPPQAPGKGYTIIETGLKKQVLVINLIGRVFFKEHFDCPFRTIDKILEETKFPRPEAIIVDIHAEATSEKIAMAYFLEGRVSAVIGTHTHVPTADYQIMEKGTAFISDVGMCGLKNSVLGVNTDIILKNFLTQLPVTHEIGTGPTVLQAVSIEIDDRGKATTIAPVVETME